MLNRRRIRLYDKTPRFQNGQLMEVTNRDGYEGRVPEYADIYEARDRVARRLAYEAALGEIRRPGPG